MRHDSDSPGIFAMRLGLVVLGGLISGCNGASESPGSDQTAGGPDASAEPAAFVSKQGNFRIKFPGEPRLMSQTIKTPVGPQQLQTYMVETPEQIIYGVTITNIAEQMIRGRNPRPMLDGSIRGMAKLGWSIKQKGPITLGKHPGRFVKFEVQSPQVAEKGLGRSRIYLVGNRLYQLDVVGPESKVELDSVEAFLDSFQLLEEVGSLALVEKSASPATAKPGAQAEKPTAEPAHPESPRASPSPSAGGATIADFRWIDDEHDVVGGHGDASKPDGTKDQHFQVELDLPKNAVLDEITITSGGFNKWVTKPTPGLWPIAVHQDGSALTKTHVERVGTFSGHTLLDLYANSGGSIGPGTVFNLQAVILINGKSYTLAAQCKRP